MQARISEIRQAGGEVVALSSRGDKRDVQRMRDDLNISFPVVSGPVREIADAYGVWHYQRNASFGAVIVDKNGIVRWHHASLDEFDRPDASKLLDVLRSID